MTAEPQSPFTDHYSSSSHPLLPGAFQK